MNQSAFGITFVFTAYQTLGPARNTLIVVVLIMYVATLFANISLLFIICSESSLHKPMYIFLFNLVCTGLVGCTVVWPKVLFNLISDSQTSSYPLCLLQVSLINAYVTGTYMILSVMAYDRYVSICRPLHYYTIMTPCRVKQLLAISNLVPIVAVSGQVSLTVRIPLCRYNLHKLFCDSLSLSNLACGKSSSDSILTIAYGIVFTVFVVVFPICLILLSYIRILSICLRLSNKAQRRALSTCIPHLIVFLNFSLISLLSVVYNRVSHFMTGEMNTFMSLQTLLLPPLIHPIIYGIRTREIRICFSNALKRRISLLETGTFSLILHR